MFILVVYISGIHSDRYIYDLSFSPKAQTISDYQERKGEKGENGEKQEKKGERKKGEKREIDLREIMGQWGGKIIKLEYDEENHILKNMIIEIPADRFNQLILKLQELGQIKLPIPSIKQKGQKTIKVRIRLQNPFSP